MFLAPEEHWFIVSFGNTVQPFVTSAAAMCIRLLNDMAGVLLYLTVTNAVAVHCDLLSTLSVKKDVVLRNKENKQCFINIVSEKLKEGVCDSIHAAGDADVLIVQCVVSVAATGDTVVIADDTDILILFCHRGKNCKTANQSRNEGRARQGLGHPGYLFCARVKPLQISSSCISTHVAGIRYQVTLFWYWKGRRS